ncbi:hypothetical protein BAY61_10055 [Prauserella marina]|uniref:Uncharacterized protein n=1 Tax=Prauserella marina TaxID=530584 RepID=A0A222VMY4_9PSEU|nr:hypothetical protein [Prauserella marina]ASR35280.1 hypothetical protein BAY61_10055 [Prauserella marina]PWV84944.1 hypothetical protein DES30_101963 [Prauserella marina]SDC08707.1 hypothetical protein SAMN05421630_101374 [Prauserella marina]
MARASRDTATRESGSGRRRASGIYGAIVAAAVLTAAGEALSTAALAVAVVATLLVYWLAEEYAVLLGQHAEAGKLPSAGRIRAELAATWPMVTASYGPLVALLLAWLAGASPVTAANVGLVAAVLLLVFHAWSAGMAARLRGVPLIAVTTVAALLGVLMVVLKNFVLLHLH